MPGVRLPVLEGTAGGTRGAAEQRAAGLGGHSPRLTALWSRAPHPACWPPPRPPAQGSTAALSPWAWPSPLSDGLLCVPSIGLTAGIAGPVLRLQQRLERGEMDRTSSGAARTRRGVPCYRLNVWVPQIPTLEPNPGCDIWRWASGGRWVRRGRGGVGPSGWGRREGVSRLRGRPQGKPDLPTP